MTPLSVYVHIPFCASRCGYCDFNTYTATELGDAVQQRTFHRVLIDEVAIAKRHLGADAADRQVETVFFGGGTPTILEPQALTEILVAVRDQFGLADNAEVTTEANPETVDPRYLEQLREGGFTRISLGMQSTAPQVLKTLDRVHSPGRGIAAAKEAKAAGFDHVNLDLIYGTPGESDDDLRRSIDDALSAGIDHLSAYALVVEDGTPLARRVRRGEMPLPDDDIAAHRYEILDDMLEQAGLRWYEVSNWARPHGECRHNLAYWRNHDWWGIGPGAHSHVDGVRWWNHKHPATYAQSVAAGERPAAGEERLGDAERELERVMLGIRLREGLDSSGLDPHVVSDLVDRGLLEPGDLAGGRAVLTRAGRLLGDDVVRSLC